MIGTQFNYENLCCLATSPVRAFRRSHFNLFVLCPLKGGREASARPSSAPHFPLTRSKSKDRSMKTYFTVNHINNIVLVSRNIKY